MLTVDFDRLGLRPGERVLDAGSGEGRHSVEAARRGAGCVVALDLDRAALPQARAAVRIVDRGGACGAGVCADLRALPFGDGAFDHVICSETLEHIPDDRTAIAELVRVLRPGGRLAVSVPRAWPERVCWRLSRAYRETEGGHVRIYRASALVEVIRGTGMRMLHRHHAHALHSPYWWTRCVLGPPDRSCVSRAYQRLLEWDLMHAPTPLGRVERWLDPVLGKSVVLYFERPLERTS